MPQSSGERHVTQIQTHTRAESLTQYAWMHVSERMHTQRGVENPARATVDLVAYASLDP